jgi:hypothetical protein
MENRPGSIEGGASSRHDFCPALKTVYKRTNKSKEGEE